MKLMHRRQLLITVICLAVLLLFPGALGSLGWNRTYLGVHMDLLYPNLFYK